MSLSHASFLSVVRRLLVLVLVLLVAAQGFTVRSPKIGGLWSCAGTLLKPAPYARLEPRVGLNYDVAVLENRLRAAVIRRNVVTIEVDEDESEASMMKRFKRELSTQGYLYEMKHRDQHETKKEKLKRKLAVW
jgi:ribosomal protein S21